MLSRALAYAVVLALLAPVVAAGEDVIALGDDVAAVEALVNEGHAALALGDFDAWAVSMAPDVLSIHGDTTPLLTSRDALVAKMKADFGAGLEEGLTLDIVPFDTDGGVEGDVAWLAQELTYVVHLAPRETMEFHLRDSVLLERRDGKWTIIARYYSHGPKPDELDGLLNSSRLTLPPAMPATQAAPNDLLTAFRRDLGSMAKASLHPRAVAFGPLRFDFAGSGDAKAILESRFSGLALLDGSIRSGLSSDGTLCWLATNVKGSVEGLAGKTPMRLLVAYVKREAEWRLAFAHLSMGLANPEGD